MALATKAAPEGAGRFDHVHGDEDQPAPLSIADQVFIEHRAAELIAERLANDREQFTDLIAGIDPTSYEPQLQRMLANLNAPNFGRISLDAITSALHQINRIVQAEARKAWQEEAEALAERDLP